MIAVMAGAEEFIERMPSGYDTVLEENGLLCDGKTDGTQQYFVSDDTESFYKVAELFLGQSVESCVECIDIERY